MSYLKKTIRTISILLVSLVILGYSAIGHRFGWHPITVSTFSAMMIPESFASSMISGFNYLGFDVNVEGGAVPPICQAILSQKILKDDTYIFEDLLALGADPNTQCNWNDFASGRSGVGAPVLWLAINDTIRPFELVESLINKGAEVNKSMTINNKDINTVQWAINSLTNNRISILDAEKKRILDLLIDSGSELPNRLKSKSIYWPFSLRNEQIIKTILNTDFMNLIDSKNIHILVDEPYI